MDDTHAAASPNFDPQIHQRLLRKGSERLGIPLTDAQLAQFETYQRALVEWNSRFNLTAITDYEEVQVKHFLDCLAGLPPLLEELGEAAAPARSYHLADIGTGAGFPGIPLKLAVPRLKVSLIDGTGKKITFLRQVIAQLQLANIEAVQGRAEELGRQSAHRGQYDIVTARAVAPLNTLVEYMLPLVRRGGYALVYKGASAPDEYIDARRAIDLLGGETTRLAPVEVPFLDAERYVVLIKKVDRTPQQYPRSQGLARKRPLGEE
ncbi:MAG: 16S rRNA (guanine(527)-N(7))-methyltransferase RsmG [Caldilineaceae bacterium]|nr:16S rRNA (guanine(527)-N(7))-methyltransferase RsmG [Caldilineaceae bacterium]